VKPLTVSEHADVTTSDLLSREPYMSASLSVVVVGASGDLAKKKTYPALLGGWLKRNNRSDFSDCDAARPTVICEVRTHARCISSPALLHVFESKLSVSFFYFVLDRCTLFFRVDLFAHGHLPTKVTIVGMARSPLTDESLREKLRPFLMTVKGTDAAVVEEFLERCSYRPVATYDDVVRFDLFDLCQMQYQIYYR
jgi:glucose-6-phosphate 1-dehydrogenase